MVVSTIGLGPHELSAWLRAFGIGLTAPLALRAARSFAVPLRGTSRAGRSGR